jgi:hypothetical protein
MLKKIVLTEKQMRSIFRFCAGSGWFPEYPMFMLEILRPDGDEVEWLKMDKLAEEEWDKIKKEESK